MELTCRMKMARFQTFWIQMQKNKHLDESHKTDQTSGTKMAFTLKYIIQIMLFISKQVEIRHIRYYHRLAKLGLVSH
ncbi:hypothetical protein Hanom_Chr10g00907461 [Helianthus anomalus]